MTVDQALQAFRRAEEKVKEALQARDHARAAVDDALAAAGFRRAAASANPLYESPYAAGYLLPLDAAIQAAGRLAA